MKFNSSSRFIVPIVSGSERKSHDDLLDFPGTASRLSPFARSPPSVLCVTSGPCGPKNSPVLFRRKKCLSTPTEPFLRALLRCLPPLFHGELFNRTAQIYTHAVQYDHCNVSRTMPIYIHDICRFFVPSRCRILCIHSSMCLYA